MHLPVLHGGNYTRLRTVILINTNIQVFKRISIAWLAYRVKELPTKVILDEYVCVNSLILGVRLYRMINGLWFR